MSPAALEKTPYGLGAVLLRKGGQYGTLHPSSLASGQLIKSDCTMAMWTCCSSRSGSSKARRSNLAQPEPSAKMPRNKLLTAKTVEQKVAVHSADREERMIVHDIPKCQCYHPNRLSILGSGLGSRGAARGCVCCCRSTEAPRGVLSVFLFSM